MTRYDWPSEFRKSPDRLHARAEQQARTSGQPTPPGLLGDLDDLDEVIQANFDESRLWLPLGPSILIKGQAQGEPIVSGRVRGLCVSPDGQRIYVGAANGGVWFSPDAGITWNPLGAWGLAPTASRSDMSLTIGALLVAFGATSADDVVYAATGESLPWVNSSPGAALGGIGILRLNGTVDAALAAPGTNPWQREARNLAGTGMFRLARNPATALTAAGAGELVAATSNGLWTRSGAFVRDADWTRVAFAPTNFDANDGGHCSDVVWNDRGLWVTLVGRGAEDGLYRSTAGTAGPFARIALPGHMPGTRLTLAPAPHETRRMYVLGLRPPPVNPATDRGLATLWLVDLTHSAAAAVQVANFPVGLFTSEVTGTAPNFVIASDQSDYDQAMVVGQSGGADVVHVGGSLKPFAGDWNASLFRLTISGTAAAGNLSTDFAPARQLDAQNDATFIGGGIHPDVHALALRGTDLWVGCDGGVFLRSGGAARAMNAGLATAEPGYIASHPTIDGPMIAGTQDNGTIRRVGNTVWQLLHKGDGGGCAYHPTRPQRTLAQNHGAIWQLDPGGYTPVGPVLRSGKPRPTREATEDTRAQFYSAPAVARTGTDEAARVFLGTDRIWYSANWQGSATPMSWVTIPTGTDPWNAADASNDINQDRLDPAWAERITTIRVLQEGDAAQHFDGMAILVLTARKVRIFRYSHPAAAASGTWTSIAASVVNDPTGAEPSKQKKSEGAVPNPFLEWLPRRRNSAWTDIAVHRTTPVGAETFYVTTTGSVAVNDDGSLTGDAGYDTLWWYNGAGRWYPTGLRNTPLDAVAGTGGCPLSAHSVVCDPVVPDIVYVGTRIGVWEGRIDTTGAHPVWTWKPAMEGLPQALVEDLHVADYPGNGTFLRAALVSRGVWERDVSAVATSVGRTFIRAYAHDFGRSALPAAPVDPVTGAVLTYDQSPDVVILPTGGGTWGAGVPNEAELLAVAAPASLARGVHDLYVMVHHRHTTPVPAASVNVDLFLMRGAPAGGIGGIALAPIRQSILNRVRGTAATFPAGFAHLGRFHPAHPVDARNSRALRTTVDLSFAIVGAGPDDHVAVIAVVTAPGNPLADMDLFGTTLEDVVRATGGWRCGSCGACERSAGLFGDEEAGERAGLARLARSGEGGIAGIGACDGLRGGAEEPPRDGRVGQGQLEVRLGIAVQACPRDAADGSGEAALGDRAVERRSEEEVVRGAPRPQKVDTGAATGQRGGIKERAGDGSPRSREARDEIDRSRPADLDEAVAPRKGQNDHAGRAIVVGGADRASRGRGLEAEGARETETRRLDEKMPRGPVVLELRGQARPVGEPVRIESGEPADVLARYCDEQRVGVDDFHAPHARLRQRRRRPGPRLGEDEGEGASDEVRRHDVPSTRKDAAIPLFLDGSDGWTGCAAAAAGGEPQARDRHEGDPARVTQVRHRRHLRLCRATYPAGAPFRQARVALLVSRTLPAQVRIGRNGGCRNHPHAVCMPCGPGAAAVGWAGTPRLGGPRPALRAPSAFRCLRRRAPRGWPQPWVA
jgi:hypothetical protein